jgi:hypothetical protein
MLQEQDENLKGLPSLAHPQFFERHLVLAEGVGVLRED